MSESIENAKRVAIEASLLAQLAAAESQGVRLSRELAAEQERAAEEAASSRVAQQQIQQAYQAVETLERQRVLEAQRAHEALEALEAQKAREILHRQSHPCESDELCDCGNKFMDDAKYCRQCGKERNPSEVCYQLNFVRSCECLFDLGRARRRNPIPLYRCKRLGLTRYRKCSVPGRGANRSIRSYMKCRCSCSRPPRASWPLATNPNPNPNSVQ